MDIPRVQHESIFAGFQGFEPRACGFRDAYLETDWLDTGLGHHPDLAWIILVFESLGGSQALSVRKMRRHEPAGVAQHLERVI